MGRKETMGVQASLNGPVDKAAATKTAALESGISYKKIVKPRRASCVFCFISRKVCFHYRHGLVCQQPHVDGARPEIDKKLKRTDGPPASCGRPVACLWSMIGGHWTPHGKYRINVAPPPGVSRNVSLPRCSEAISRAIERPSP